MLSSPPTPYQLSELQEKRLSLIKQILRFRKLQYDIQPDIRDLLDTDEGKNPEDDTLFIPSSLISLDLQTSDNSELADMEARLRYAQLTDTLSGLRRALAVVAELTRYKHKEARGVSMNTRAQSLIFTAQKKVREYAMTYRRSRTAYLALRGSGKWEETLRELRDEDVRFMSMHQDEDAMTKLDGPREGHRLVSWIYTASSSVESSMPEFSQGMSADERSGIEFTE
jgi:hypothetical protein